MKPNLVTERRRYLNLTVLDLSFTRLSNQACGIIVSGFASSHLEYLDLSCNLIRDKGALCLAKALFGRTKFLSLHVLKLSGNILSETSHFAFGKVLLLNQTLTTLNLGEVHPDFRIDLKEVLDFLRSMNSLSKRISKLYLSEENREEEDLVCKVQNQQKCLRDLDSLREKILNQNEVMFGLDSKIDQSKFRMREVIQKHVFEEANGKLIRKIQNINSLPALQKLKEQLERKVNANKGLITEKKDLVVALEAELNASRDMLKNISNQQQELMMQKELVASLNCKVAELFEQLRVSRENLLKLSSSKRDDLIPESSSLSKVQTQPSPETLFVFPAICSSPPKSNNFEITESIEKSPVEKPECPQQSKPVVKSVESRNLSCEIVIPDEEDKWKELLLKGGVFSYREKFSLLWKSPRFLWVSDDLHFLCLIKGTSKDYPIFVTRFGRKFIKLKPAESEFEKSRHERSRSLTSVGSHESVASTVSEGIKMFNPFRQNTSKRALQLTLYEYDDFLPAEERTRTNMKIRRIILKAQTVEQKYLWEKALKWWLSSKPLTQHQEVDEVVEEQNKTMNPFEKLEKTSPFAEKYSTFHLTAEELKDPDVVPEEKINILVLKIRDIIKTAFSKALKSKPLTEGVVENEKQSLNITYKNVREEIQDYFEIEFDDDKWRMWFRNHIDICLEEYEESSGDESEI